MDADSAIVVLVTTPPEIASKIAHVLIERHLAACVNIIPEVRSVYRWNDGIEEDIECVLVIKTTHVLFEAVSAAVRENHPYSVPEVIALPITDGFDSYLRWVRENVRLPGSSQER